MVSHLHVDYPQPHEPLFANRRAATGWCLIDGRVPASLQLLIDGRAAGIVQRYFRADAPADGGASSASSSGFRCEFDPTTLSPGAYTFTIVASDQHRQISSTIPVTYGGLDAPCYVSDVFVDVVGYCNLRCAMCPQGDLEGLKSSRPMGVLDVDMFERIVDRLQAGKMIGPWINLYNWGDPLLHPRLDRLLAACRARKLKAILSTNLAMPSSHVQRMLDDRTELLIVSISGMTQATYARNHRGGRIDKVLDNLATAAARRDAVGTVVLKYLAFDYNRDEVQQAHEHARELGIEFGVYLGAVPSAESFAIKRHVKAYAETAESFVSERVSRQSGASCPQESTIIVDHIGDLEVCCVAWRNRYGRSVLTTDLRAYLMEKLRNPTCASCLTDGYAFHKHFGVLDPELLPLGRGSESH